MGDRFLRDGLIRSDRYNALSLDARDLFIRLIVITDDFGSFDGRDNVIAHAAYYHGRPEALPLDELHRAGMIVRYLNGGRPFLAVMQWGERLRLRRQYPAPPINIDLPDTTVTGKFGRTVNWRNPPGTDAVSVLLDINGRPVAPQPQEWRRVDGDWSPLRPSAAPQPQALRHGPTAAPQALPQGPVDKPSTLPQGPAAGTMPQEPRRNVKHEVPEHESSKSPTPQQTAVVSTLPQALATAAAPNGEIELMDSGEWHGVSEEQRLKWQGMFDTLSIPDQLERAAQWLLAKPEKRSEYASVEGGLRSYIVNWLLREARGKAH